MNRESLLDIAHSGVLAPSADNQHVFSLELVEAGIRLRPTPAFANNTERHRRVLGLLSLGAVVENMRLRAAELGFAAEIDWLPEGSLTLLVDIRLHAEPRLEADALAPFIAERHTNRRMYRGPAPTDAERAALGAEAAKVDGVRLVWLAGPQRSQAQRLIWLAESERFLRRRLHEELFSSIRFDLSWRASADRALPPAALEVEPPMRPMFKALRRWPLMNMLNRIGMHRMLGLRAGWLPAWQAPALGVIATTRAGDDGALAAGAAFERMWLCATRFGLALQPMAASTVLSLQSDADEGASRAVREALTAGWQQIVPGWTPLMVFRMGHAAKPAVRAGRPSLETFIEPA